MALRLVKIAKELNVGTSTIVDYLNSHGFEIEDKPTAKVSDEMYDQLVQEFQKDRVIKEQADQLIFGTRSSSSKKEATPTSAKSEQTSPPASKEEKKEEAPEEPEASASTDEQTEEKQPEERPRLLKNRLKVLGKVDLDKDEKGKSQPKTEKKEEKPEEKPVEQKETKAKPEVKKQEEKPTEAEQKKEKPKPETKAKPEPKTEKKEEKPAQPEPEKQPKPEAKKEQKSSKSKKQEKKPEPPKEQEVKAKEEKSKPAEQKPEKTKPAEQKKKATQKEKEDPSKAKQQPAKETEQLPEEEQKKKQDRLIKAEAPELRGLKILGKIDTDKFKKPKKKKEKDKKTSESPAKKGQSASDKDDDSKKRRRRKRKKITTTTDNRGRRQDRGDRRRGRGKDKEEAKEVSQKEIEEKIKATMARLSGGGKKKRQKMRRDNRERIRERQEQIEQEQETGKLEVTEFISVSELASLMNVAPTDVITACMNLGVIVSINQRLDAEIIELIAEEFGHEVEFISVEEQADEEVEIEDDPEDLEPRAPIVTVMGHVDHGKTSLLDFIREASVVSGEAGGITQHIGAYEVYVDDKKITFLDTPGHEAFTAMRARGAKITDIAIVVIAADDSIMPQTREAISHAQAAGVPIVFAINKIDKPEAQPERIKQELASMNYLVEEWGGKYQSQDISAKTGENIDLLLEKVLLEAEIQELKANPHREATGAILEASLDKGRGYVAKVLVQSGSLDIGDTVAAGEYSGKIKAMFNERGQRVKSAGPSTPVLLLGLDGAPQAGERLKEYDSDQEARQIANRRAQIAREQANRATKRISLDEIGRRLALGSFKELNLIVKGDVDGSVEALSDSLIKLSIETVQVNVIHRAVGAITESDVLLASASDAIIIGFQVRPTGNARQIAEREGVQIKMYSIIYEAINEIKSAIEGMLEPTKEEKITAQVEVREVFKISKVGTVAGCYVQEGKITRNTNVRLIRDGIVVYPTREGAHAKISSLKRFKDDVKEVRSGLECGISIENYNDIKVGDIIEGFEIIEVKQKLE